MKRYCTDNFPSASDIFISSDNLNRLDGRQSELFHSRRAFIYDLAYSICRGGKASADEIQQNYFSVLNPIKRSNIDEAEMFFSAISVAERIEICNGINTTTKNGNAFSEALLGQNDPCPTRSVGRISYVKNNFTDSAYLIFSKKIRAPRCFYSDSFDIACEDVFNGESEFCILPIETSSDGKLFSFYSLIDRYELKIISVCSVEHPGSSKFTRFALLRRSISMTDLSGALSGKNNMLELKISQSISDSAPIYDIFKAADICQMPLLRVDSLPLPYSDSLLSYYAVFGFESERIKSFLTYTTLEFPQCYILGIYSREI